MSLSLLELAQHLGLSKSTVSRALNGYKDVSAQTRQKVMETARDLGYEPDPAAVRLATGKTDCIAVVTSSRADVAIDIAFPQLLAGITAALNKHSYYAIATSFPVDGDEMAMFKRFVDGRFTDGMILTRTRPDDPRVRFLQERNIPFVTYGRTLDASKHAWVDTDGEYALATATQWLLSHDHTRVGLLNGPRDYTFSMLRRRGYEKALHQAGIALDETLITYAAELDRASCLQAAQAALNAPNRPHAFACCHDMLALSLIDAAKQQGLSLGKDIEIASFSNPEVAALLGLKVTAVEHSTTDHGEALARLVLHEINARAGSAPPYHLMQGVLKVRE
jgi:LacI family transcriptional regulator